MCSHFLAQQQRALTQSLRVLLQVQVQNQSLVQCQRLKFSRHVADEASSSKNAEEDEFRVLQIQGLNTETKRETRRRRKKHVNPPRYQHMPVDQDWPSVWPAAATFKWSAVPFPVRQGYIKRSENDGVAPEKYANAELMKIPNFLHLTPVHVAKQCAAIKKYCTAWPEGLETDKDCERYFPVTVTTSDYLFSGPSLRHPAARTNKLEVKLSSLQLDARARDKMLRLVSDRYCPRSDVLTLTTDRCPTRRQNYDYARYLLSVLYLEAQKHEAWEDEKAFEDLEYFDWDKSNARQQLLQYLSAGSQAAPADPALSEVAEAVQELHDVGEDDVSTQRYSDAVKRLLNLRPLA